MDSTEPTDAKRDSEDISLDSEEEEAAAMAAAMGFSGFGKAPALKKRKYNPKTDAFVEGQELEKIDRGGKKGQGSGGNQVPLGKVRVLGEKVQNEEEIVVYEDEDENEEEDDRPMEERCLDTSRPAPIEEMAARKERRAERRGKPMVNEDEIMLDDDDDDDDEEEEVKKPERRYKDLDDIAARCEAKLYAVLARYKSPEPEPEPSQESEPTPTPKPKKQKQKPKPPQGLRAFMAALHTPVVAPPSLPPAPGTTSQSAIPPAPGTSHPSVPQRPPPPMSESTFSESSRGGRGRGERGQRNELWYVDYYDQSFNENPWAGLEKKMGLQSVGSWVERTQR